MKNTLTLLTRLKEFRKNPITIDAISLSTGIYVLVVVKRVFDKVKRKDLVKAFQKVWKEHDIIEQVKEIYMNNRRKIKMPVENREISGSENIPGNLTQSNTVQYDYDGNNEHSYIVS